MILIQNYMCEHCDAEFQIRSFDTIEFCPFCSNSSSYYEVSHIDLFDEKEE